MLSCRLSSGHASDHCPMSNANLGLTLFSARWRICRPPQRADTRPLISWFLALNCWRLKWGSKLRSGYSLKPSCHVCTSASAAFACKHMHVDLPAQPTTNCQISWHEMHTVKFALPGPFATDHSNVCKWCVACSVAVLTFAASQSRIMLCQSPIKLCQSPIMHCQSSVLHCQLPLAFWQYGRMFWLRTLIMLANTLIASSVRLHPLRFSSTMV